MTMKQYLTDSVDLRTKPSEEYWELNGRTGLGMITIREIKKIPYVDEIMMRGR